MKKQISVEWIKKEPEGEFLLALSGNAHELEEDLGLLMDDLWKANDRWWCECFYAYAQKLLEMANDRGRFEWDFQFLTDADCNQSGKLFVTRRNSKE